ncbi:MAG: pilus assembly protein [Wenzhouxiangellaceae bacterium]
MKRFERIGVGALVAIAGFIAGMPASATLNLSQNPLFLVTPVQPALIMAMDDSGSMDFEVLLDANDGSAWWNRDIDSFFGLGTDADGTADIASPGTINFNSSGGSNDTWQKYSYLFPNGSGTDGRTLTDGTNAHFAIPPLPQYAYVRSPEFNAIYYNPGIEYPPWPSEGNQTFGDANPLAAKADPVRGNQTWNLTENQRSDNNNWTFRFQNEMVIPPGTVIKESDLDNCSTLPSGFSSWTTVTTPIEINENICNIGVEYFPATFWLKASTALPAGYGYTGSPVTGGRAPDGTPMLGYEIKPINFSSSAAYSRAIQQFANWFQYYRKRVHLTRAAIGRSFIDVDFLRVGFHTINNRTDVTMRDMAVPVDREEFFDWQYDLRGSGGTPNRQAVAHLGNQFRRTGGNAPILEACQRNFGMLVTDGFSNAATISVGNADGALPAPLGDSVSNTLADLAYTFYEDNLRPDLAANQVTTPSACGSANPPLALDCRDDPHMNFFSVTLGARGLIFGRDQDIMNDPYGSAINWPTSFPQRHPSSVDDIWHAVLNTRGEMFTATRPDELVEALSAVLREIASRIQPVGVSATSSRIDEESQFFESELNSTTWSGNLRAIDANTGAVNWSAGDKITGSVGRSITTTVNGTQVPFNLASMTPALRTRIFGNAGTADLDELLRQNAIIAYLRGDQSNEESNGGPLRNREGLLGDIANSRPTFVGATNEGWGRLDPNYVSYVEGAKQGLDMVLVGANDGMLHAFDANADTGGDELFAYIPSMVHEELDTLADPNYVHRFFVDGQIGVGDVQLGGWTTVAVAGLGAGGKGAFAINLRTRQVLWELSPDSSDPNVARNIGHVFGKPIVTRAGNRWVAIFGNGYNSDREQAGLFVVDIATGNASFVPAGPVGDNGLSEVGVFLNPLDGLNVLRAYAGDLQGNMWRFDFSGASATTAFSGSPLIQVDNNRAITAGPTLATLSSGGVMVFFGSGKLVENIDRVGNPTEFDRFWAVPDRNSRFNNSNSIPELAMTTSGSERVIDGDGSPITGWTLDLGVGSNVTGERVLSRPEVSFGRLLFTTFEPDEDVCAPGGVRRIYFLNALTGSGAFNALCQNCGVVEVGLGAPIDPAIIIRPPATLDPFGDGSTPNPFDPEGGGSGPDGGDVGDPGDWCSTLSIRIPGEGEVPVGNICDGRQAWRQAR